MSNFLTRMKDLARSQKRTIVLPEGEDPRVREAARKIVDEDLANLVILGDPAEVSVPGARVIDPAHAAQHEEYARALQELRKAKGMTYEQADELVRDNTYFGTMMVKLGDADGLVSGACHSTANTLRPALQILKTAPGTKIVSSFMVVVSKALEYGDHGTLIFADIGLNEYPDAEGLAEIAISSARSWEALMRSKPYVAMLSYSTHRSANSSWVDKMSKATEIAQANAPEIEIEGEIQADAALVESVAKIKIKGESNVPGKANVLVFPNLDAGNIGYKLVQRLGGAEAYGPLLQGIAKPVNDLSRGCSADDIVGVVAITAVQAQLAD